MYYRVYTTNGERFTFDIGHFDQDSSGVTLYDYEGTKIAFYLPGQVAQLFPEASLEEAEIITEE